MQDLKERTKEFASRVIRLYSKSPSSSASWAADIESWKKLAIGWSCWLMQRASNGNA